VKEKRKLIIKYYILIPDFDTGKLEITERRLKGKAVPVLNQLSATV
jgi:hypothetical protein